MPHPAVDPAALPFTSKELGYLKLSLEKSLTGLLPQPVKTEDIKPAD